MEYRSVAAAKAYELLNPGGVVWVCTRGADGRPNLAPIAWNCALDYVPVSRCLFVCDPGHLTFANIEFSRAFILALPTWRQKDLVLRTGDSSGRAGDKYEKFGIAARPGSVVDALIPEDAAGWLECRLLEIVRIGSVALIAGEVLKASAAADAWTLRLHHAGGDRFYKPGEALP